MFRGDLKITCRAIELESPFHSESGLKYTYCSVIAKKSISHDDGASECEKIVLLETGRLLSWMFLERQTEDSKSVTTRHIMPRMKGWMQFRLKMWK